MEQQKSSKIMLSGVNLGAKSIKIRTNVQVHKSENIPENSLKRKIVDSDENIEFEGEDHKEQSMLAKQPKKLTQIEINNEINRKYCETWIGATYAHIWTYGDTESRIGQEQMYQKYLVDMNQRGYMFVIPKQSFFECVRYVYIQFFTFYVKKSI